MSFISNPGSVSALLQRVKDGDHEAVNLLWHRYYPRLIGLARKKLQHTKRRVADEEDVVLSAFDSFCREAEQGRFPDLQDRDGLWALLVVLTARKAADLARFQAREKRGGGAVQGDSALQGHNAEVVTEGFDGLPGEDPTPEEAALLAEEVDNLLKRLPDKGLQAVATKKLEGLTNAEIAAHEGVSVPTVERRLAIIRRILKPS